MSNPEWISVADNLPPMFENCIVYGRQKRENVCTQAWQARRWTGCSSGFDVEKNKLWEWLTPCDFHVEDVTHWMPLPETRNPALPPPLTGLAFLKSLPDGTRFMADGLYRSVKLEDGIHWVGGRVRQWDDPYWDRQGWSHNASADNCPTWEPE